MNKDKYFKLILERGIDYNSILSNYFIEEYNSLDIDSNVKNRINLKISQHQNFDIQISELALLLPSLKIRIEELLNHPDFNPFKEQLRQRFPEQYGSNPFKINDITYYLYPKTFPIDSLIVQVKNFKELVEAHIKAGKPLKYVYKE